MDFHKFDIHFDVAALNADLEKCRFYEWSVHFNHNDYTGKWSSLALRSISGNETDIRATPGATFLNTPVFYSCKYFRDIVESFQCPKEAVRLLSLSPKSEIREHIDLSSGYKDGFFRIHIPVQTNSKVVFRLNGHMLGMQPGECWYGDFNLPHYVSNHGDSDRIHLVIDCLRNEWSDQLFESAGYDFEREHLIEYDRLTKLQIIEQLERLNTNVTMELAQKLRTELG